MKKLDKQNASIISENKESSKNNLKQIENEK